MSILSRERDRIQMPAVIRFVAVDRTAIAVEMLRLFIGAAAEVLDLRDAGAREPRLDVARKVKQRVSLARRRPEKSRVGRVRSFEAGDEFRPDLVTTLL